MKINGNEKAAYQTGEKRVRKSQQKWKGRDKVWKNHHQTKKHH